MVSLQQLGESGLLSLHAYYRSILVLTSQAFKRACQSQRRVSTAPIRSPEQSSRLNGQRRILGTQPRATPEHERHFVRSLRRLYFPQYIFPPRLSVFGHRAILIWGIETCLGGCSQNKPIPFTPLVAVLALNGSKPLSTCPEQLGIPCLPFFLRGDSLTAITHSINSMLWFSEFPFFPLNRTRLSSYLVSKLPYIM